MSDFFCSRVVKSFATEFQNARGRRQSNQNLSAQFSLKLFLLVLVKEIKFSRVYESSKLA